MQTKYTVLLLTLLLSTISLQVIAQTGSDSLFQSAVSKYNNYKFKEAIDDFNQCLSDSSTRIKSTILIGKSYLKLGQSAPARTSFYQTIAIDSNNIQGLNQLARIYYKSGVYDSSIVYYSKLEILDTSNVYYQKKLAYSYKFKGDIIKTLRYFNKALGNNPNDAGTAVEIAKVYVALKYYTTADSLNDMALYLDSSLLPAVKLQAKIAYKRFRYEECIAAVNKLNRFGDSSLYAMRIKGISQYKLDNYSEAIETLSYLVKKEKGNDVGWYYLGLCMRDAGEIDNAIVNLRRALKHGMSKNIKSYYSHLAISYEMKKDYPNAIKAYKAAYALSRDEVLLYHLARNYDYYYDDKKVGQYFADMFINKTIIVELKASESLKKEHEYQLINYLYIKLFN